MKGIGVIEAPSNLYPNYARNSNSTTTFITNSYSYYNKSSSASASASSCSCFYMNLSFPTTPPPPTTTRRRSSSTTIGITFLRTNNNTLFSSSLALTSFQDSSSSSSSSSFIVVNFYRFVFIDNPHHLVSTHLSFLQDEGLDIHGRIYLNEQGINAQYSAPSADALTYLHWIKQDCRFSDVFIQISPAKNEHSFPRLKLRYKPSLVQLEGGISHLPLLDPSMRAIPLAPSEWRNRLQATNNVENQKAIVLDVRNGYEWDIGHFRGAQRPDVDCFRSTSFGLSDSELTSSDPLASVDKGKTDILMYCTGGIRCDIYSSILRQRGFQNLFTLKGGVSHYLQKEGPVEWIGNLFVFDSRLSLPPSSYNPQAMTNGDKSQLGSEDSTFARCYICQSRLSELRHRNCANLDCNRLFLCCSKCMMEVRGCCCLDCTCAPRLRPILPRHQRYEKWHTYRDADCKTSQ